MFERPSIGYATSDEVSLAYLDLDGGPHTVVIVPGIITHLEQAFDTFPDWGRMLRRLNQYARVIAFDKRGCGMSDPIVGAPSLEERLADLDLIFDATGIEAATLCGISEGGPISLLYAAARPDRVKSLILCGTYAKFVADDDYPWGASTETMEFLLGEYCDEWGTGVSAARYLGSESIDPERKASWAQFERACCTPSTMRKLLGLLRGLDVRSALPLVSCPALVIAERDDRGPGNSIFLAESLADAELCLLDGTCHTPFFGTSNFDDWMNAFDRFISGRAFGEIDVNRVLATVVFTDIVDSTSRAARVGDLAWSHTIDRYEELAGELSTRFGGHVVKSTGDGVLALFDGPARAVRYTAELRVAAHDELDLTTRSGAHVGEVELRGDDIAGLAVHVAARIQAACEAGQILVSDVTERLCLGSGLQFEQAGSHELKGLSGPWDLRSLNTPR